MKGAAADELGRLFGGLLQPGARGASARSSDQTPLSTRRCAATLRAKALRL